MFEDFARHSRPLQSASAHLYELNLTQLYKAFLPKSVVYVTVGDVSYHEALANHFTHFRNHGLLSQLLVACLDNSCCQQCWNSSIHYVSNVENQVPETKLRIIPGVLAAQYQLLFFDADVFFIKHPMAGFFPGLGLVSNIDMEFQTNGFDHLNFGFFLQAPQTKASSSGRMPWRLGESQLPGIKKLSMSCIITQSTCSIPQLDV